MEDKSGQAEQDGPDSPAAGPRYHRLRSRTQTVAVDEQQERSGELWGRPAVWSHLAAAKAYMGPLPAGASGVEFTAAVPPANPDVPAGCDVYWYAGLTPGVATNEQGFAVISITVVRRVP